MKKREPASKEPSVHEINQAFETLRREARKTAERASRVRTTVECRRELQQALEGLDEKIGTQDQERLKALGACAGTMRGKVRQLAFLQAQSQKELTALQSKLFEAEQHPGSARISKIPSRLQNPLSHPPSGRR